jgi:hypothetical protein
MQQQMAFLPGNNVLARRHISSEAKKSGELRMRAEQHYTSLTLRPAAAAAAAAVIVYVPGAKPPLKIKECQ